MNEDESDTHRVLHHRLNTFICTRTYIHAHTPRHTPFRLHNNLYHHSRRHSSPAKHTQDKARINFAVSRNLELRPLNMAKKCSRGTSYGEKYHSLYIHGRLCPPIPNRVYTRLVPRSWEKTRKGMLPSKTPNLVNIRRVFTPSLGISGSEPQQAYILRARENGMAKCEDYEGRNCRSLPLHFIYSLSQKKKNCGGTIVAYLSSYTWAYIHTCAHTMKRNWRVMLETGTPPDRAYVDFTTTTKLVSDSVLRRVDEMTRKRAKTRAHASHARKNNIPLTRHYTRHLCMHSLTKTLHPLPETNRSQ